jgi:hypothetical protein
MRFNLRKPRSLATWPVGAKPRLPYPIGLNPVSSEKMSTSPSDSLPFLATAIDNGQLRLRPFRKLPLLLKRPC